MEKWALAPIVDEAVPFYPDRPLWNYVPAFPPGTLLCLHHLRHHCLHGCRLFIIPVARYSCDNGSAPGIPARWKFSYHQNFAFDPSPLTVRTGTVVTWTNQDAAPHTIVSDAGSPAAFSSDSLSTGASYTFTFTQPGTYTYHCSIHPQ